MKLWQIGKRDRDLERELQSDLELEEEEQLNNGKSPEEARYAARRAFGNFALIREQTHEAWGWAMFEHFGQDIGYGLRQFRRSPGFAITAILVLTLGIGVSVALFAFVDAALLEPLPYVSPNRLMSVNESSARESIWPLSYSDFLDWQRLNTSFSSLAIYSGRGFLLRASSGTEPVQGERVSGGFLSTLGVQPMLGRDFTPDEARLGGPKVVILSYGAWIHRFGARRNLIGQTVDLDNEAWSIIGVLPRSFTFAPSGDAEFWVPINSLSPHEHSRTFYAFMGIGRLHDGISPQIAQAEMTAIAQKLQQQFATTGRNLGASVLPLSEVFIGNMRPILLTLLAGAGLLLLIACVNVASLMLVRAESRKREVAVREALGATPARLVRQFVNEGFLFAASGALSGSMLAAALIKLLANAVPKDMAAGMPFLGATGFNAHTCIFAASVALLASLLLAATPALRLSLTNVRDGLAEANRGGTTVFWRRLGANLVVVELTIAVVLLVGAGLLTKSLYLLLHVPLGFDPDHLATLRVVIPSIASKDNEQTITLNREIMNRVSSLPGVQSVGAASMLPVECNCAQDNPQVVGRPNQDQRNEVDERHVSSDYFPTLRTRLLSGRNFTESDDASRPGVVIVNQALARKYFPGESPVGQKLANDEGGRPSVWEIVGVVDDIREGTLDDQIWPAEYFPINQTLDHEYSLAVRTGQDPGALLPLLVTTLHQLDPRLGISDEATMADKIDGTQAALLHRFAAWLVSGFAGMALLLGVIGLYGVIAYSVTQRTREIGVRMALGARRSSVYGLILGQAGRLTGIGLAIGLGCSVGTSILISKSLFAVKAWDLATLSVVALVLALASLVASLLPARRAASVDPVQALRSE